MRRAPTRGVATALVAVLAVLCALSLTPAYGATAVDDYASRLQRAAQAVEAASGDVREAATATDLAARLRMLLPEREDVIVDGTAVTIDDPVLADAITSLSQAASTAARQDAAETIAGRLASLQAAVGVSADEPLATDPAALARIIDEERIGDSGMPDWLTRLEKRIREWLEGLLPDLGELPEPVYKWILPTMSALAVLVASLLVWRLWRRGVARRDGVRTVDGDGGALPVVAVAEGLPDDALAYADAAAADGRYRDAVRALFGGAARELGEHGVLPRTRTRTTAELLADVADSRASLAGSLGDIATVFEPAWYGHRDPGERGFASARAAYAVFSATLGSGDRA